jgi:hypothetical protein
MKKGKEIFRYSYDIHGRTGFDVAQEVLDNLGIKYVVEDVDADEDESVFYLLEEKTSRKRKELQKTVQCRKELEEQTGYGENAVCGREYGHAGYHIQNYPWQVTWAPETFAEPEGWRDVWTDVNGNVTGMYGSMPGMPVEKKRSCNRHDDCDKADIETKARGGNPLISHCNDDTCEDCFGQ